MRVMSRLLAGVLFYLLLTVFYFGGKFAIVVDRVLNESIEEAVQEKVRKSPPRASRPEQDSIIAPPAPVRAVDSLETVTYYQREFPDRSVPVMGKEGFFVQAVRSGSYKEVYADGGALMEQLNCSVKIVPLGEEWAVWIDGFPTFLAAKAWLDKHGRGTDWFVRPAPYHFPRVD